MIKFKAVIFDLDDTLYLEKEFTMGGFKAASEYLAKKYKISYVKILKTLKADFKSGLRKKNFDELFKKFNLPKCEIKNVVAVYRNHNPKIKLYPDAKKTLNDLSKIKAIKLGMISDGLIKTQKNKIETLRIKKYFKAIILSDKFGIEYRKPNKKPFLEIAKKLKINPEEAIYVGDNPLKDFVGAKNIGMVSVMIKRKKGYYTEIEINNKNKPNFIISNLKELKKYVR